MSAYDDYLQLLQYQKATRPDTSHTIAGGLADILSGGMQGYMMGKGRRQQDELQSGFQRMLFGGGGGGGMGFGGGVGPTVGAPQGMMGGGGMMNPAASMAATRSAVPFSERVRGMLGRGWNPQQALFPGMR